MTADAPAPSSLHHWPVVAPARTVFEHRHYPTVLEEDLRLPSGRTITWLRYADHRDGRTVPDGVMGICAEGDRVLLARQYNPGADRIVWEFPGGGTHPDEDHDDAVRRELMEEVGLYPKELRYLGRYLLNNRRTGWGIRTYLCTDLHERELPSDEGELIESYWMSFDAVDEMIRLGEIDNVTVLAGWAMLRSHLAH